MASSGLSQRDVARRWTGAFALLALGYIMAWPFVRDAFPPIFGKGARAEEKKEPPRTPPRPEVAMALAQAKTASEKLERAAEKALEAQAAASAERQSTDGNSGAESRTKETATACVAALLPDGTLGDKPDLAWMCDEQELWVVNRFLYDRIATRGLGPGVQQWIRQGRFNLAAIAILRARCCPDGEVFSAVQATNHCGSLGAALDRIVEDPSVEHVDRYQETIECLMERKVQVPISWAYLRRKPARRVFDEFVSALPPRE